MTILGQEQPVIYRMDDMFDPTTAQMFLNAQQNYVNAMREDYMQAAQDLKNYNKEFADFYSPYEKDNESWDRLAKEPIRNLMANYGPDMLRSQEGRARIAQAIASVPSGQLAKLRASAAQGLQALKVKAELEAKGLYSQDYQDFLDKMNGRTSFKDWDTLKDGVYNSTFSPFQGLGEVTDYIYKGRQPLYKGMKNGSRVYSYDYNDLLNAAQSNAQDFIATPRGAFEWSLAQNAARQQNPNASAEEIQKKAYEILDNRIAKANMRYLSPERYEADPYALARFNSSLRMAEQDHAMQKQKQMAQETSRNQGILQYSTRKNYDLNASYLDKTLNGQERIRSLMSIENYWNNRLNKAAKLAAKYKNSTDAKTKARVNNEYKYAKAHATWWKNAHNWNDKTLIEKGLITADNNGVVVPTSRFTNAYDYSNKTDITAGTGNDSLMRNAANFYGKYQIDINTADKSEADMWKNIFANTHDLSNMPGTGNKYRSISLNDSGLRYAPIRQANVSGNRMYQYNSVQRKFDRWLRSGGAGNGYLVLGGLKLANIPKKNKNGNQVDIQGNVSITNKQFKEFCQKNGITNYTKAAVELGLRCYSGRNNITVSTDDVDDDSIRKDSNKYVDTYFTIPMIRTKSNNGGFFWRDLNTLMNKNNFGAAKAYAEEPNAEAASVIME